MGHSTDGRTGFRVPSQRRDALTGEPLPPDTQLVLLVRDERIPRSRYRDDDATVVPSPLALHRSAVSPEGRLGGPRYSSQFTQRLDQALMAARRELGYWWRDPYAQDTLRRSFTARYGATRGSVACSAALAILEYPDAWVEIAAACGHSAYWIGKQRSFAYSIAFPRTA